jgi:hypothetical protein
MGIFKCRLGSSRRYDRQLAWGSLPARERIEMPEPMDRLLRKRASREYLWFVLILLAVLAGSLTRQTEINDSHARVLADQTPSDTKH